MREPTAKKNHRIVVIPERQVEREREWTKQPFAPTAQVHFRGDKRDEWSGPHPRDLERMKLDDFLARWRFASLQECGSW